MASSLKRPKKPTGNPSKAALQSHIEGLSTGEGSDELIPLFLLKLWT